MSEYSPIFRASVLDAVRAQRGYRMTLIARAFRIHPRTLQKWVKQDGMELPSARERMSAGAKNAEHTRWGDWRERRKKARELRSNGSTLRQIADAVGYRNESGAHYAVRSNR